MIQYSNQGGGSLPDWNITGKEEKEIPPSFFVSKLRHMSPSVRKPTIAKYDTAFLGRVSGDT